jgi:endo-1,4-beta-xylanase
MKKKYYSKGLLIIFILALTHLNGQTLKSLADAKGKNIGNLMRDGFFNDHQQFNGATDEIVKTEYNMLVTGNKLKMSNLLGKRPVNPFNVQISDIKTADIDRFIKYADDNNLAKRGHVMVYSKQSPRWLNTEAVNWTAQQVYDFTRTYIIALSTYTKGRIDEWDVINEAILDGGAGYRNGTWFDIVNTQANDKGEIGYLTFFANMFKWAREGDPNVELYYNDYSIESIGTGKNNFMRTMVKNLKNIHNAPIDGVGLQCHFSVKNMTSDFINKLGQNIDDLALSGFKVSVTELDIKICEGDNRTWENQKVAYRNVVSTALSRSNCKTLLIWGVSDNDSWIPAHSPGCGEATPHDDTFQKKPAYFGVQEALNNLTVNLNPGRVLNVTGPSSVALGETVTVFVDYEASEAKDIVFQFQRDNNPYTTYQAVRTTVSAGFNKIKLLLTIPQTVPIVANDYKYQVYIANVGGGWNDRIGDVNKVNISVTEQSLSLEEFTLNKIYVYPNPISNILVVFQ